MRSKAAWAVVFALVLARCVAQAGARPPQSSPAVVTSPNPVATTPSPTTTPSPSPTVVTDACPPTLVGTLTKAVGKLPKHQTLVLLRPSNDRWLALLPLRPNGSTGWIPATSLQVSQTTWKLQVDLAARRLTVTRDCQTVRTFPVAVGKPSTPTPKGAYYLDALYQLPASSALGPYAYTLSGHSNVLFTFDGGEGRLGLHGTNDPAGIGQAVSHGCIRLNNADIRWLVPRLPLGTPVVVR